MADDAANGNGDRSNRDDDASPFLTARPLPKRQRNKGGHPHWPLPDLKEVEGLAMRGLTMNQIASFYGVSARTIYTKQNQFAEFKEAIKRGAAKGIAMVTNRLWEDAVHGDNVVARIFFLKARAGWREGERLEITGPDGGAIPFEVQERRYEKKVERVRELIDALNESNGELNHKRLSQSRKLPIGDAVETTSTELNSDDAPCFDDECDDDEGDDQ